jgi:hypothetical protein
MRPIHALALALTLGLGPTAAVAAPPSPEARFEALLRSIDDVPPSPAAFLAAFPDAPSRLAAAARDARRDHWTRLRALSMLSFFPTEATQRALTDLARDPEPPVRADAVLTLGRVLGARTGAAADGLMATLDRALADASPAVREKAVRALRWCQDDRAATLLSRASERPELRRLAETTASRRARLLRR